MTVSIIHASFEKCRRLALAPHHEPFICYQHCLSHPDHHLSLASLIRRPPAPLAAISAASTGIDSWLPSL